MANPIAIQTLSGATPTWDALYKFAKITASANVAITISGAGTPDAGILHFKQDATGSRTLTINGISITVNTAAGSLTQVSWAFDGEDYTYHTNVQGGASGGAGATQLSTPSGFTATASGTNILLAWNDVSNESSYLIEYSSNGTTWSELTSKAAGSTTHTHTVGTNSTTVYYRLSAIGDGTTYSNSGYAAANATTEEAGSATTLLHQKNFTDLDGWTLLAGGSGSVTIVDRSGFKVQNYIGPLTGSADYAALYKNGVFTIGDVLKITITVHTIDSGALYLSVGDVDTGTNIFSQALSVGVNVLDNINTTGATDTDIYFLVPTDTEGAAVTTSIKIEKY